jgi:hypothetical protein
MGHADHLGLCGGRQLECARERGADLCAVVLAQRVAPAGPAELRWDVNGIKRVPWVRVA